MNRAAIPAEVLEVAVRLLRNRVYEQETSENNWQNCHEHWMLPQNVRWLVGTYERQYPNKSQFLMKPFLTLGIYAVNTFGGMLHIEKKSE